MPQMDPTAQIQDTRDSLWIQIQGLLDRSFQSLELSSADWCTSAQAAGAAVSTSEAGTDPVSIPFGAQSYIFYDTLSTNEL